MAVTKKELIDEALERGVAAAYPSKPAVKKALESGKKLRIYLGIDPTGVLHIGHGVQLLKLRQFQQLGHEITILFGGMTARIGDPTDKLAARQPLTKAEVTRNAQEYKKLIGKILDLKKTRFVDNATWLEKLTLSDLIKLASEFTVQRLLERDMFQQRLTAGKPIHLHEFLYPIMQGYDSVVLDTDLEIGGSDQTFNMLAGRMLFERLKHKEKFVITTKLLEDPTGKKMGKSEGNFVAFKDQPNDMYGKVMSWPDTVIKVGFEIATTVPFSELKQVELDLKRGKNPKILKMLLAYKIVELYHGAKAAIAAEENFKQVFEEKLNPDEMPRFKLKTRNIVDALVETKLASSKSEARRLLAQQAIRLDTKIITDVNYQIGSIDADGVVLQRGKRHFAKII